jgi:Zn-dependent peptidase ImmA (M78 family)/transcriptional regulator with XRE-family HTH domain
MSEKINPYMIVLARESRGMKQNELAKAIAVTQGKISKYENGVLPITDDDIEAIAEATDYATDFFFQIDKIYGLGSSFIFNRKRKNVPALVQKKVQALVNIMLMQVNRLLRSAEIDHENTFRRLDIDDYGGKPVAVARATRSMWNVPLGPIANVTSLIESAGGIVVQLPFETNLIDAVHLWADGMPPMFVTNSEIPGDRLRWTLAHEIGHAIMHKTPTEEVELQANEFASEFLMPKDEIKSHLYDLTLERAATLKPYWKVSMAAIIRRAVDLNCISERRYRTLNMSLSAQGYKTNEPFPIEVEQPKLLGQIRAMHEESLGYTERDIDNLLFVRMPNPGATILKLRRPLTPVAIRNDKIAK